MGNGFLARSLRPITRRHPGMVVVAAGVSWASGASQAEYDREARLVSAIADRCSDDGRRLVFFSTAATGMYGLAEGPGREDAPVVPGTPYGEHKWSLEELLRGSGVDHLILRLGHLVGPGQPSHQLLPTLVAQLREGTVHIQRGATRDLIDVADVVVIIDRLLEMDLSKETVNVASGVSVPVERIVDHLQRRLGLTASREYRNGGSHHVVSIDKLRDLVPEVRTMGFGPNYYRRVLDGFVARTGTAQA
ncbi:nucleoside-diphosphate-sugar epimerase [Nocardiopsis terrae]|uniref:Nucleoside-diphosphate-sugar epimerase n=1 Tax=Nocardiopsis terrae TaxID=372655 RepID=A0ABR9HAA1_9ACTN|nr:SDR family oxidoreductase [Nocardiopsis terrae]MBE1455957.1 nucleoside-diphosphate-sugar epimerase [Nocardiopsis terrae]